MSPSSNDQTPDHTEPGPEVWVPEAIAQQEEYLKRQAPCEDVRFREHQWRQFGVPGRDGIIHRDHLYDGCIVCGVTRTDDDYQRRLAGRRAASDNEHE